LHIQPEWYFLFAYAILRSIPNKLGGVIALALSVFIFYILPFLSKWKQTIIKTNVALCWFFLVVFIILTWIGGKPVEEPYVIIGQIFTFLYFLIVFLFCF
jgi:ubiquinol-cytochrome c reductase cytochrome b subunit